MITGDHIGPLRIERPLGAGGMGEVYLARDERLERLVAVKLLPEGRSVDFDARGRMLREARAASALKHPSIVTVYDIGEHEGRAYIVMEYVEGDTFDQVVATRGALPPDEAVALVGQAADAVGAAHAAGVLHRDLKSANLMRDASGLVKVLDFGLSKRTDAVSAPPTSPGRSRAKIDTEAPTMAPNSRGPSAEMEVAVAETMVSAPSHSAPSPSFSATGSSRTDEPMTEHGARMGTPGWAPPELIDGLPADARSDVFALGAVLYHLLAGRPPFTGTSWTNLREQMVKGPPPPSRFASAVPAALDRVVLGALSAEPAQRPATPGALMTAARAALGGGSRGRTALVAGVAVVVGGGVLALAVSGNRTSEPKTGHATSGAPDAAPAAAGPVTPTVLTKLGGCSYSPTFVDDHTITFDLTRDGAVDLYKMDIRDGTPVQLTSDPGWEWRSSRGASDHEVAFIRQDEKQTALETLDLATGAREVLLQSGGPIAHAGDAYYYSPANSGSLRRISAGHDAVFATAPPGHNIDTVVASPDGKHVAMLLFGERALPRICTADTTASEGKIVCLDAKTSTARVAFSSRSDALYFDSHGGIARIRIADGATDDVLPEASGVGGVAVAPSGGAMVFSDCGAKTQLVSVLEDPAHPISTEWPALSHPTFGAEGRLAYVRANARVEAILLRETSGSVRELVARDQARFTQLGFSGDGEHLVYTMADANLPGIYVACTCTEPQPNRVTEDPSDDNPLFAGDQVVFTRRGKDGTPQLMRVGVDGSGLEVASRRPRETVAADAAHHRLLLASPAFDYLYWWDWTTGRETAGPKLPKIGVPVDVAMSPDGRWLVLLGGISGQDIWRMRLDKAVAPERVFQLPQDVSALAVAIDDRGMPLVAVDRWAGELWLATAPAGAPW